MISNLHWTRMPGDRFDALRAECGSKTAACFTTDASLVVCEDCKRLIEEATTQKIEVPLE